MSCLPNTYQLSLNFLTLLSLVIHSSIFLGTMLLLVILYMYYILYQEFQETSKKKEHREGVH